MKYLITMFCSFIAGIIFTTYLVMTSLNSSWDNIGEIIRNQCSNSSQFSDGGICIPKGEFVAVVRNADNSKTLIWGGENINKFRGLPVVETG